MKTTSRKTATKTPAVSMGTACSDEEFHHRNVAWLKKFQKMSLARKRAFMISIGALNPDGTVRRYPMDHVPLGPRG